MKHTTAIVGELNDIREELLELARMHRSVIPPAEYTAKRVAVLSATLAHVIVALREPAAANTWTFMGHWENDRIVIDYARPGEVEDDRIDLGQWEQGLWAATATGATMEEARAGAITEYEEDRAPGRGPVGFPLTDNALTD